MTLYEAVMDQWLRDQEWYCLGGDFATKQVNALTNEELLQAISDALEAMKESA